MPVAVSGAGSMNVLVIGHEGHGKSTLAAAIAKVMASKKKTKPVASAVSNDKITRTPVAADKGDLTLIDCDTDSELETFLGTSESISGILLVVDIEKGIEDQTRSQLNMVAAHLRPNGSLIVFLNKLDLAEHQDDVDLLELSVRELLSPTVVDAESTPFYRGSAQALLDSNDRKAQKPILDLMKDINKLTPA